MWESDQGFLPKAHGHGACGVLEAGRTDRIPWPAAPDCLPRSAGLFPEADIPEEAYRNPRGGRRNEEALIRIPAAGQDR